MPQLKKYTVRFWSDSNWTEEIIVDQTSGDITEVIKADWDYYARNADENIGYEIVNEEEITNDYWIKE